jgi:hypothetical protein
MVTMNKRTHFNKTMAEQKTIMVLFEDGNIRNEVISYAIELARRMETALGVLMLLADDERDDRGFSEERLTAAVDSIRTERIPVSGDIRYGDKTSEFLKFLASANQPYAIVWGSNNKVITKRGVKPGHWLTKAARHVDCSIISPTLKTS